MMNVVFRVDASVQIGSGHLMRCLTLADSLMQHGATVTFVARHMTAALATQINALGAKLIQLQPTQTDLTLNSPSLHAMPEEVQDLKHCHWLGVGQLQDAQDTLSALMNQPVDWLIVDHYALDFRWQQQLRKIAAKILVIDDLADRIHDCDVLLDQNQYLNAAHRYKDKLPTHCVRLLGARYAILRQEFVSARQHTQVRTGDVKRLLMFFGGMDADNYTGRLLAILPDFLPPSIAVDVVIGAQHPDRFNIEKLCEKAGYSCHVQTQHMAQLMLNADLAVGAGGSANWERCCLGLPSLAFAIADNQRELTPDAALQGLLESPMVDWQQPATVAAAINMMINNSLLRERISQQGFNLVDGNGTQRVVSRLLG